MTLCNPTAIGGPNGPATHIGPQGMPHGQSNAMNCSGPLMVNGLMPNGTPVMGNVGGPMMGGNSGPMMGGNGVPMMGSSGSPMMGGSGNPMMMGSGMNSHMMGYHQQVRFNDRISVKS